MQSENTNANMNILFQKYYILQATIVIVISHSVELFFWRFIAALMGFLKTIMTEYGVGCIFYSKSIIFYIRLFLSVSYQTLKTLRHFFRNFKVTLINLDFFKNMDSQQTSAINNHICWLYLLL